jgi:hypothetical protein
MRIELPLALCFVASCAKPPDRVVADAMRAIERGDVNALAPMIAEDYADPLGGKKELIAGVRDLLERFGRVSIRLSEVGPSAPSKVDADVVGRIDVDLSGEISWRVTGPLEIALRREDGFLIRYGVLTDVRDILGLMDERRRALEANDADGYARLLHPTYKDGDTTLTATKERLAADLAGKSIRLRPSLYKLEVRGPLAHVDEHYVLSVSGKDLPAAVARLTLERAAGRWRIVSGLYREP